MSHGPRPVRCVLRSRLWGAALRFLAIFRHGAQELEFVLESWGAWPLRVFFGFSSALVLLLGPLIQARAAEGGEEHFLRVAMPGISVLEQSSACVVSRAERVGMMRSRIDDDGDGVATGTTTMTRSANLSISLSSGCSFFLRCYGIQICSWTSSPRWKGAT